MGEIQYLLNFIYKINILKLRKPKKIEIKKNQRKPINKA